MEVLSISKQMKEKKTSPKYEAKNSCYLQTASFF